MTTFAACMNETEVYHHLHIVLLTTFAACMNETEVYHHLHIVLLLPGMIFDIGSLHMSTVR